MIEQGETLSPAPASQEVVDYYDQTWVDYRLVWLNRLNSAMHFG